MQQRRRKPVPAERPERVVFNEPVDVAAMQAASPSYTQQRMVSRLRPTWRDDAQQSQPSAPPTSGFRRMLRLPTVSRVVEIDVPDDVVPATPIEGVPQGRPQRLRKARRRFPVDDDNVQDYFQPHSQQQAQPQEPHGYVVPMPHGSAPQAHDYAYAPAQVRETMGAGPSGTMRSPRGSVRDVQRMSPRQSVRAPSVREQHQQPAGQSIPIDIRITTNPGGAGEHEGTERPRERKISANGKLVRRRRRDTLESAERPPQEAREAVVRELPPTTDAPRTRRFSLGRRRTVSVMVGPEDAPPPPEREERAADAPRRRLFSFGRGAREEAAAPAPEREERAAEAPRRRLWSFGQGRGREAEAEEHPVEEQHEAEAPHEAYTGQARLQSFTHSFGRRRSREVQEGEHPVEQHEDHAAEAPQEAYTGQARLQSFTHSFRRGHGEEHAEAPAAEPSHERQETVTGQALVQSPTQSLHGSNSPRRSRRASDTAHTVSSAGRSRRASDIPFPQAEAQGHSEPQQHEGQSPSSPYPIDQYHETSAFQEGSSIAPTSRYEQSVTSQDPHQAHQHARLQRRPARLRISTDTGGTGPSQRRRSSQRSSGSGKGGGGSGGNPGGGGGSHGGDGAQDDGSVGGPHIHSPTQTPPHGRGDPFALEEGGGGEVGGGGGEGTEGGGSEAGAEKARKSRRVIRFLPVLGRRGESSTIDEEEVQDSPSSRGLFGSWGRKSAAREQELMAQHEEAPAHDEGRGTESERGSTRGRRPSLLGRLMRRGSRGSTEGPQARVETPTSDRERGSQQGSRGRRGMLNMFSRRDEGEEPEERPMSPSATRGRRRSLSMFRREKNAPEEEPGPEQEAGDREERPGTQRSRSSQRRRTLTSILPWGRRMEGPGEDALRDIDREVHHLLGEEVVPIGQGHGGEGDHGHAHAAVSRMAEPGGPHEVGDEGDWGAPHEAVGGAHEGGAEGGGGQQELHVHLDLHVPRGTDVHVEPQQHEQAEAPRSMLVMSPVHPHEEMAAPDMFEMPPLPASETPPIDATTMGYNAPGARVKRQELFDGAVVIYIDENAAVDEGQIVDGEPVFNTEVPDGWKIDAVITFPGGLFIPD